ncbi:class I SAM-dependent methyltransferase [Pedobacter endophyticus]|uniref:Class I SAM-dependent methyltransferase n=1 Tax=Pedobacter endophyticus TaxID=2789740 RepID=A0A7U3Q3S3_9SPHI|nr:class I SAM-dependent methyltransferase [Pedobacter endophyticus]QPH38070.1 class I SAM-dependent methyltransferase [Pedobacter endophyticus]
MESKLTEKDFNRIAEQLACPSGEHGLKIGKMMHASNAGMTHAAIDALNIQKNEAVLEIGHGNGGHINYLLEKNENIAYFGADISSTIINEAKKVNEGALAHGRIHFELTDGTTLPFTDEKFDKVFTVNTIYFWNDPMGYLTEIKRVMRSNGLLVIAFADRGFMEKLPFTKYGFTLYNLEEVIHLIAVAGFKNVKAIAKRERIADDKGIEVERSYYLVEATA